MLEGKRIFVTGATGFIGSHLITRLLTLRADVHILYRTSSAPTRLLPKNRKLFTHNVDIRDFTKLKTLLPKINPQAIFHLANAGVYQGIEKDPKEVTEVNLLGTINLLHASASLPYSIFVNTGSSSEYGPKAKKMKESDACSPQGLYATTKLAGTVYAASFARLHRKPVVTLRLFSPYGPQDDPRRLIPSVIKKALQNEPITIGGRKPVRDFIFIEDVIDAYIQCLRTKNAVTGEILNVGSGKQYSVGKVVDTILYLTKSKSNLTIDQTINRNESSVWRADITKVKNRISWQPATSLQEGLKKTIEWYKDNITN